MLAIGVNHKWDACPRKGSNPSTGPPTYQIIKVTNVNHMSVMKTSLTIIPMCPRERFPSYKSLSRLVPCYKKDWAILLHLIYFHYLLPVSGEICLHEHLWGPSPFLVRRGVEVARRADRGDAHKGVYPASGRTDA